MVNVDVIKATVENINGNEVEIRSEKHGTLSTTTDSETARMLQEDEIPSQKWIIVIISNEKFIEGIYNNKENADFAKQMIEEQQW